jgi:hypothetical protein
MPHGIDDASRTVLAVGFTRERITSFEFQRTLFFGAWLCYASAKLQKSQSKLHLLFYGKSFRA